MSGEEGSREVSVPSQVEDTRLGKNKPLETERAIRGQPAMNLSDREWIAHLEQENTELREQAYILNEIFDSIKDGFLALDSDWRFTYINQRAAANIGLKPGALTGRSIWEALPELAGTELETNFRKVMASHNSAHFELKDIRQDQWYFISVYPTGNGISAFWQETTQRKQIETQRNRLLLENRQQLELLLAERSHLETVLQYSLAGIMMVDAQGGIRFCNPAAQQMMGVLAPYGSDINSHTILQLNYPGGGPVPLRERPLIKSAFDGLTVIDYEYEIVQPNGHRIHILGNSAPIFDTQGNISGAVAVFADITGRKQAERHGAFLQTLGQWLIQVRSPEEVMRGITEKVALYLEVNHCFLSEVDFDQQSHGILCSYQGGKTVIHYQMPISFFPASLQEELLQGKPVIVEDISIDFIFQAASLEKHKIRSILAIPWIDFERNFARSAVDSPSGASPVDAGNDRVLNSGHKPGLAGHSKCAPLPRSTNRARALRLYPERFAHFYWNGRSRSAFHLGLQHLL